MALALVAGAGVLSVTACTAGVTTASSASSPATSPAATGHSATGHSASAAASSPGAAPSASTVAVSGPLGNFPIPVGAKVAENVVIEKQIVILFTRITPANVEAFYTKALPQAGYTVSGSELVNEAGGTAFIEFSGHGYKGDIAAVANFTSGGPGGSVPGLGHKNVSTITLMPQ